MPRILLVEDDPEIRFLWEHFLAEANYQVDTAETAEAGGDLLNRRYYDLVITDGRLRDGTGMAIAGDAQKQDIPAIIVTGYAFILRELAVDSAKYQVLLKPIRPSELLQVVTDALPKSSETTPVS
jgi:two-component system response regulator PilR (NtrC family)